MIMKDMVKALKAAYLDTPAASFPRDAPVEPRTSRRGTFTVPQGPALNYLPNVVHVEEVMD
jgi:hypothetical protein